MFTTFHGFQEFRSCSGHNVRLRSSRRLRRSRLMSEIAFVSSGRDFRVCCRPNVGSSGSEFTVGGSRIVDILTVPSALRPRLLRTMKRRQSVLCLKLKERQTMHLRFCFWSSHCLVLALKKKKHQPRMANWRRRHWVARQRGSRCRCGAVNQSHSVHVR